METENHASREPWQDWRPEDHVIATFGECQVSDCPHKHTVSRLNRLTTPGQLAFALSTWGIMRYVCDDHYAELPADQS